MLSTISQGSAAAAPRSPRPRLLLFGGPLASLLLFCGLFFGLSWLVTPEPEVSVSEAVAVTKLEGRDVVVAAYSRSSSRGMFQLMFQPMFQTRLAAVDADTGEHVWDVRLDERVSNDVRVLAAGKGRVYVAGRDGLYIRSLADGSAVAQPDSIDGLGDEYVPELGAYDVDTQRGHVVAIDQSGELWQIPIGEDVAEPADQSTTSTWGPVLADDFRFALDLPDYATAARVDAGTTIASQPISTGALKDRLELSSDSGVQTLADMEFFEARFVLDGGRSQAAAERDRPEDGITELAAGSGSGYVIVVSATNAAGSAYRVDTVDLSTGAVLGTAGLEVGYTVGGGYSGGNLVAFAVASADRSHGKGIIMVVPPDGSIRAFPIGATNFFGWPL